MKKTIILSILMLITAFAANAQTENKTKCPNANNLNENEIKTILDEHNKIRADVGLPKLVWNCDLADFAQEWATRGVFEHRLENKYGENIFVAGNLSAAVVSGVNLWHSEKAFWNNSTAVCQTGKVCGHYTQIVWRSTTEIGCGINRNAPGKFKVIMVCNYNPAGNYAGRAY
jgi:pathogenesis-related protein 1